MGRIITNEITIIIFKVILKQIFYFVLQWLQLKVVSKSYDMHT
jgi:hypothetical protein